MSTIEEIIERIKGINQPPINFSELHILKENRHFSTHYIHLSIA